jgi:NADH-quinone oxidoreductase subunit E
MMLHEKYTARIEAILAKYDDRRSAVMPLLYIAQDEYGYLSNDAIREVATILDMPYTDVFEVVSFYTLYYDRPMGTWVVQVCDDVPCCYLGAEELITALKQTLGVQEEQVTDDGMFTIQRVKCLAACHRAPVVQANLDYVYDVTAERADALLRHLRQRAERGEPLSISGHHAEDYEFGADGELHMIERRLGDMPQQPAPPITAEQPEAPTETPEAQPE